MNLRRGFTLIELLVVVAVLGILAAGVLVAINPIEQTNKARDATAITKAKEFTSACDRYYASNAVYPANCTALETAKELIANSCTTLTGGIPPVTVNAGNCSATFTPRSTFYLGKCGATCDIPGDSI